MSASQEEPENSHDNNYVLEAGGVAEMTRLMRQDQLLTQGMGGIFPENLDLSTVHNILDLACGPGGWALETAFAYADIEIIGVDLNERTIAYANAQAEVQQRSNVHFQVMNILQSLAFPDNSFDLVNARYIIGFMRPEAWPTLIKECLRVLRPGGFLRFTEFEWGGANKPCFEEACATLSRTMSKAHYTFSPGGHYLGLLPVLPSLFRKAGLQRVKKMAHAIEFSADTDARDGFYYNVSSAFQTLTSFVTRYGISTEQAWTDLYQKGLAEMYEEDFCAMWLLLTVWGNKPV
jgi:ubiquinone/menaquinone biosynthesis C-methylase UbiE